MGRPARAAYIGLTAPFHEPAAMEHDILETTVEAERACEHMLNPEQRNRARTRRQRLLARLLLQEVIEGRGRGLEMMLGRYMLIVRPLNLAAGITDA